jgi:hypothetical protein
VPWNYSLKDDLNANFLMFHIFYLQKQIHSIEGTAERRNNPTFAEM